jgi:hypothetical protein
MLCLSFCRGTGSEAKWRLLRYANSAGVLSQRLRGFHKCIPSARSCVPDTVHPRTKMMYAAARDDIKRALDASRFAPDYHVTDAEDLTWAEFTAWADRSDREASMSHHERVAAADVREQARDVSFSEADPALTMCLPSVICCTGRHPRIHPYQSHGRGYGHAIPTRRFSTGSSGAAYGRYSVQSRRGGKSTVERKPACYSARVLHAA